MNQQQKTGMAGELLVAAQLFRRGFDVALTFTNTKAVDIFAFNPRNDRTYAVQVKTLRKTNCFPIRYEAIRKDHVYIFVLLRDLAEREQYFIASGTVLRADRDKYFGSSYKHEQVIMPAINIGPLRREHTEKWEVLEK